MADKNATYKNIVVLTGAGISAESGVATFRDAGGLWEQHRIEDVATHEGFARNPDLVQHFYNLRRAALPTVAPNAAHLALARLEAELHGHVAIVTQNVDDLHARAGSRNILHMHGELKKIRCTSCDTVMAWETDCTSATPCPACGRAALRPDIVWFGEMPFHMEEIMGLLHMCDLFIAIGTSGQVYPAAGFVAEVRAVGRAHTIEINLEPSDGTSYFAEPSYFAEYRHGRAGDLVPLLVDELLK